MVTVGGRGVRILGLRRFRSFFYQFFALLSVLLFLIWVSDNTVENLQRANMVSGFGFLDQRAGFGVSQALLPYTEDSTYARALLVGFFNTLLVAVCGIFLASVIGFVVGIGRLSRNWIVRAFSTVYVETFRNIPPLLVVFFWYFGVLALLPMPRDSIDMGLSCFLNNRGVFLPRPVWEGGGVFTLVGLLMALLSILILR